MVKDIERLDAKLHRHPLRQFRFLKERQVHLPTVQSPNDSISGIAEAREVSIRVHRRGPESRGIDELRPQFSTPPARPKGTTHNLPPVVPLIIIIRAERMSYETH